jgi:hypothetical protein
MNKHQVSAVALAVSAVIAASVAFGQAPSAPTAAADIQPAVPQQPQKPLAPPRVPHTAVPAIPDEEVQPAQSSNPSADISPAAAGTTLSPPVTITYSGSSSAVTIKDSGTNRGLSSTLSSSGNSNSAVYGETTGKGAGVKGINYGTGGPGGVFQVTDSASSQPGLSASTSGTGSAIVGNITKTDSSQPAIFGQSTVSAGYGIGVEGAGNEYGVYGTSPNGYAVYGSSTNGYGVLGYSEHGTGMLAESESGYGLYAYSSSSDGIYTYSGSATALNAYSSGGYGIYTVAATGVGLYASSSGSGHGITAHSASGIGLYSSSDTNYAIVGLSKNTFAVIGEDSGSGIGVYGSSVTGYAGEFNGKVGATGFVTLSDRNAKTDIGPVDSSGVLERISKLPITTWTFKAGPKGRHVGPMAQDFHASFGLNGEDDTHINLADAAGVSLVAIQELNKRLKQKDAQIVALQAQLKAMNDQFSERMAKLEQRAAGSAETVTASLQSEARGARAGGQN